MLTLSCKEITIRLRLNSTEWFDILSSSHFFLEAGQAALKSSPERFQQWLHDVATETDATEWQGILASILGLEIPLPEVSHHQQAAQSILLSLLQGRHLKNAHALALALEAENSPCSLTRSEVYVTFLEAVPLFSDPAETILLREIAFEWGKTDLSNIFHLILLHIQTENEIAPGFYTQAAIESLYHHNLRFDIGSNPLAIQVLMCLLDWGYEDLFFDLFTAMVDCAPTRIQATQYAWLAQLAAYYLPEQVSRYDGLWQPKDLLHREGLDTLQKLFYQSSGKGFSLIAPILKNMADQYPPSLRILAQAQASLWYGLSAQLQESNLLLDQILQEWDPKTLETLSEFDQDSILPVLLFQVCYLLPYTQKDPAELQQYQHGIVTQYGNWIQSRHPQSRVNRDPLSARPLRVGYLSNWATGALSCQSILAHDPDQVHSFIYYLEDYTSPNSKDPLIQALKEKSYAFRSFLTQELHPLVNQLQSDQLDILVYLDGLNSATGVNAMTLRGAPCQISWISESLELPEIDFYVTDPWLLSREDSDLAKRLTLPSYVAVDPWLVSPTHPDKDSNAFQQSLQIPAGAFIYWSPASACQRSQDSISAQVEILRQVPQGILLVQGVGDMTMVREVYHQHAQDRSVKNRIRFLGSKDYHGPLEVADVILDTFPVNGSLYALAALRVGTPVLTQICARSLSSSLLAQTGLNDCIAESTSSYITLGIRVAQDINWYHTLRQNLQRSYSQAALWDPIRLSRCLEDCYRTIL